VGAAPVALNPRLFELRAYMAQPGRRDELITMFEDVFLSAYEAVGTRVAGSFLSLDNPDQWVWVRAFADAVARGQALQGFYGGAIWQQHADACNATIRDIDEAMLLTTSGGAPPDLAPVPRGARPAGSAYTIEVFPLSLHGQAKIADFFHGTVLPVMASLGIHPVAMWITDPSPNTYPRQPVHARPVFAVVTRHDSPVELQEFHELRSADKAWKTQVLPGLEPLLAGAARLMRLAPTARSPLR
jgi:hypothetical protein